MLFEPSFRHDYNSSFGQERCDILAIQRLSPVLLVHPSAELGFQAALLARIPSGQESKGLSMLISNYSVGNVHGHLHLPLKERLKDLERIVSYLNLGERVTSVHQIKGK